MSFKVTDLRENMNLGGARPTLFEVQLTLPSIVNGQVDGNAMRKLTFSCRSSELPSSNLGTIGLPYFGRIIKQPGDRTFAPWNIRIINDEDFVVRDAFETWHNIINARRRNVRQTPTSNPAFIKASGLVKQFGRTGEGDLVRTYTFQGVWPSVVSGINVDWGAQDQVEEFDVTLEYDWHDVQGSTVRGGNSVS